MKFLAGLVVSSALAAQAVPVSLFDGAGSFEWSVVSESPLQLRLKLAVQDVSGYVALALAAERDVPVMGGALAVVGEPAMSTNFKPLFGCALGKTVGCSGSNVALEGSYAVVNKTATLEFTGAGILGRNFSKTDTLLFAFRKTGVLNLHDGAAALTIDWASGNVTVPEKPAEPTAAPTSSPAKATVTNNPGTVYVVLGCLGGLALTVGMMCAGIKYFKPEGQEQSSGAIDASKSYVVPVEDRA
jgi:hypothetical protein